MRRPKWNGEDAGLDAEEVKEILTSDKYKYEVLPDGISANDIED